MKHKIGDSVRIIANDSNHSFEIKTYVTISKALTDLYIVFDNIGKTQLIREDECESIETTSKENIIKENIIKEIFIQKELLDIAKEEINKLKQKNKVLLNLLKSHGINVESHE